MKISGFGYCDYSGKHVLVDIHMTEQGKYYCQIEIDKSEEFNSMNEVWEHVVKINETRKYLDI
jgi:hypothetical protein